MAGDHMHSSCPAWIRASAPSSLPSAPNMPVPQWSNPSASWPNLRPHVEMSVLPSASATCCGPCSGPVLAYQQCSSWQQAGLPFQQNEPGAYTCQSSSPSFMLPPRGAMPIASRGADHAAVMCQPHPAFCCGQMGPPFQMLGHGPDVQYADPAGAHRAAHYAPLTYQPQRASSMLSLLAQPEYMLQPQHSQQFAAVQPQQPKRLRIEHFELPRPLVSSTQNFGHSVCLPMCASTDQQHAGQTLSSATVLENAPMRFEVSGAQDSEVASKVWHQWEDDLIMRLVRELGMRWRSISAKLPGHSDDDVRNRYHRLLRALKQKEESKNDDSPGKPEYKCSKCGQPKRHHECSWKPGVVLAKDANRKRARTKRTTWSEWEDELISKHVGDATLRWAQIAALLPGRTEHAVRNRWHRVLQEQANRAYKAGMVSTVQPTSSDFSS
mmetsp:Transcript_35128/g.77310  ORF Transcript_35128/g.77310 Transcript_35128/m.77310 type:complete len:438 (-) Transcript_35128:582-1895(-)